MQPCDHEPILDLLERLEEGGDDERLLEVGSTALVELENDLEIESARAAVRIRWMLIKSLAITDRRDESILLMEETHGKYREQQDEEVLYWLYSTLVASADVLWQSGQRDAAVEALSECIDRHVTNSHSALRTLALRAATDRAACYAELGSVDQAWSSLTGFMAHFVDDREINVQEEFAQSALVRYQLLSSGVIK